MSKLTEPLAAFSRAASRSGATASVQYPFDGIVSHRPEPPPPASSTICFTVRVGPVTVAVNVPSICPSGPGWPSACHVRSRIFPFHTSVMPGGGGGGAPGAVTANPPTSVATPPPGLVTVTSRAPTAASATIVRVAWSCVAATVTPDTVTPAPRPSVAPLWKFVPVTVTGTVVPCTPLVGVIPLTAGTTGTTVLANTTALSANVTVSVSVVPGTNLLSR